MTEKQKSLNPYCNGRKNRIMQRLFVANGKTIVLILIVMEERIGLSKLYSEDVNDACLNPYCNGRKNRMIKSMN